MPPSPLTWTVTAFANGVPFDAGEVSQEAPEAGQAEARKLTGCRCDLFPYARHLAPLILCVRTAQRRHKMSKEQAVSESDLDDFDDCVLCGAPGGEVVWESALCRVVMVDDADYPGYCRIILHRHLREMTDLPEKERTQLMNVVFAVERAVRCLYQPDKINLASLGNMTPHVHWHLIPRWRDDRHFPFPVWAAPQRASSPGRRLVDGRQLGDGIIAALRST